MPRALFLLPLALGLACTKPGPEPAPVDLGGTQWHGLFAYPGETTQRVVSLRLKADGGFVWQDLSGPYEGTWKVAEANDKVVITFKDNGIQTSFSLRDAKSLADPQNLNHTAWTLGSLQKIDNAATPSAQSLAQTRWAGAASTFSFLASVGSPAVLWLTGLTKDILGNPSYQLTGSAILLNEVSFPGKRARFFGVFTDANTLRGNVWTWNPASPSVRTVEPVEELKKQ